MAMLPVITNKYEDVICLSLQEIQVPLDRIIFVFVFKLIMDFLFVTKAALADLYSKRLVNKERKKKNLLVQKSFEYRAVANNPKTKVFPLHCL